MPSHGQREHLSDPKTTNRVDGATQSAPSVVLNSRQRRRPNELLQLDLARCFCQVHVCPIGEADRLESLHPVIQAAWKGEAIICHADEAVRAKDTSFLRFALSKERAWRRGTGLHPRPKQLEAARRVAASFKSSNRVDHNIFGRGYCYLKEIDPRFRWPVARLLGPDPYTIDTEVFVLLCGTGKGGSIGVYYTGNHLCLGDCDPSVDRGSNFPFGLGEGYRIGGGPRGFKSRALSVGDLKTLWEEVVDEVPEAFPNLRLSPFDRGGKRRATNGGVRALPHRRCRSEPGPNLRVRHVENESDGKQGHPAQLIPLLAEWLKVWGVELEERHFYWLNITCSWCEHGKMVMPHGFPVDKKHMCPSCVVPSMMADHLKQLGIEIVRKPDVKETTLGGVGDCWKAFTYEHFEDDGQALPLSQAIIKFKRFLTEVAVECSVDNCAWYRDCLAGNRNVTWFEGKPTPGNCRCNGNRDQQYRCNCCHEHIDPRFLDFRRFQLLEVEGGLHLVGFNSSASFRMRRQNKAPVLSHLEVLDLLMEKFTAFANDHPLEVKKARCEETPLLALSDSGCVLDWTGEDSEILLGLTAAVVMGTIGDLEPTLDVVAANYFQSQIYELPLTDISQEFEFFPGTGSGWCATDFQETYLPFAKALSDRFGTEKGSLVVSAYLWNEICWLWGGELIEINKQEVSGAFPGVAEDELRFHFVNRDVPPRPPGKHKRVMPEDFVLVSHPDHLERVKDESWETVALPIDSKEFIAIGQRILQGGFRAVKDMKAMHETLYKCLNAPFTVLEQSDLIYLVSGTTFHYFIGSVFKHKQVFEVCPVPREDNGVCPEFYLGHYFKAISVNPHFSFQVGRLYAKWLTAPKYLRGLEWAGTYTYSEPPKFHTIMPWAAEKWQISSPNVGFKPYDDFCAKADFSEKEKIKVYFSLGSCESIPPRALAAINWLKGLRVDIWVDHRWSEQFAGYPHHVAPFFDHALGLADFDWVVHHGGSGTTNTCLAVGVPQTIVPIIGDQFIWEEALSKQLIHVGWSEEKVRACLFVDRLPPTEIDQPPEGLRADWIDLVNKLGFKWVTPFLYIPNCCWDHDVYGYPELLDKVVAHSEDCFVTVYDIGKARGSQSKLCLKWIRKDCFVIHPRLPGRRGFPASATLPDHAHGWLGYFEKYTVGCIDTNLVQRSFWSTWEMLRTKNAYSKSKSNPWVRPKIVGGTCSCGREDDMPLLGQCGFCLSRRYEAGDPFDDFRNASITEVLGFTPMLKPLRKSLTFTMGSTGQAVRSTKRYFQLDSRALDRCPNYRVGRALLDRVEDLTDVRHCEAFWLYTKTQPPHYQFKTWRFQLENDIKAMERLYSVGIDSVLQELVGGLTKSLSVGSFWSKFHRSFNRNLLTSKGRSFIETRWHVLVDGLRHFDQLAKDFGLDAVPTWVAERYPVIPSASYKALISWSLLAHRPIRTRAGTKHWLELAKGNESGLRVHLFSLKLSGLGPRFGVFHAVVEFQGKYWELQQVFGEKCRINVTKHPPEGTPDRPLVKTILVNEPIVGFLDQRVIERGFDDLDYRVLGDNCLVFANMLVYFLTGKVVPWHQFGAFGIDVKLDLWPNLRSYGSSLFFLGENEERLTVGERKSDFLQYLESNDVIREVSWVGPKRFVRDYGMVCVRRVDAAIRAFEPDDVGALPMERDHLIDFLAISTKNFGVTGFVLAKAIMTRRLRRIPTSKGKFRFLERALVLLRQLKDVRLVSDIKEALEAAPSLRFALRRSRKVAWTPLVNITVPRHWFRSGPRLVEIRHDPENIQVQSKKRVVLDLPQIFHKYKEYFPDVDFPNPGFKYVKPGEYEIGVKVPIRKNLPKMDQLTSSLVKELMDMHPFELGVFSLRFGTQEMAEAVTDRYFTGALEAGQLLSEAEQDEIAQAIFENETHLYENAQLLNVEEIIRKWHLNYSAGFPFRFNEKGNASRQALIDQCGGRNRFLECVKNYIRSPEAFPTVSHAFIKDEVLPLSYVEREKIRTIIAQDPLNYFLAMCVQGDHNKRLDPSGLSAVGVSPAHGEMAALAESHLPFKHHYAMDITAMDSTAAVDAVSVIKKLRKKGFASHHSREAIETIVDATFDNLVASWIIDIHTGRARLKKQGLTTGHASTTPANTEYMRVLMLKAWKDITGRPAKEFYETVRFSTYSDDNIWSTSLDPSVFSAKLVSDYWLQRGVQVRVEGQSDDLSELSFLAKRFSFEPEHLQEISTYTTRQAQVALVHDRDRLLQKFSDYKKKNTLRYRWEKFCALQMNCAHHKDVFDKVGEYLDVLEKELLKRKHNRRFLQQHPRKTYKEIMCLMYEPGKHNKSGLIVHSQGQSTLQKLETWWDTFRADIMTFDSDANTFARMLQNFTGILEIGGLNIEDPHLFMKGPGELAHDPEYTLEHHLYLLNGCPESFEKLQLIAAKSPFSAFMDLEGFWTRRECYDLSEETANGLRVKVLWLLGLYTLVAWLEQCLFTVPLVGSIYKVFCSAKYLSERAYSRLNSLYFAAFGESSLILSSLMPKDRYFSLKVIAHKIWCSTTSFDFWDHSGDVGRVQDFVDALLKVGQDLHNLVFENDFTVLLPVPGTGERDKSLGKRNWVGLDHSDSVLRCIDLLQDDQTPIVTAPTAAGKSTDFIVSLSERFDTVIVACPRTILVQNNPVAGTRLYAGCKDKLTPGVINFGTAGYLRRVMGDLPPNTILVLDEFHELYEDALWLLDRYPENTITISATPDFPGSERLTNVHLTKSRAQGFTIVTEYTTGNGKLEEAWDKLLKYKDTQDRVLVVVPTIKEVEALTEHAASYCKSKRVCQLYRGNATVLEADWYFATSVVDAGLTIPGVTVVIDTGWSMGYKKGKFVKVPSSQNVSDQRKGRTGRTCNGTYVRLHARFDNTPFDFSTAFLCNNWFVASKWMPGFTRGLCKENGVIESLPGGYKPLMDNADWSSLIYLVGLYDNRGDVNAARAFYQTCRKFPERKEFKHLMGPIENQALRSLVDVERKLYSYRIPGTDGNMWSWNLHSVLVVDFTEPIPKHLRDDYGDFANLGLY